MKEWTKFIIDNKHNNKIIKVITLLSLKNNFRHHCPPHDNICLCIIWGCEVLVMVTIHLNGSHFRSSKWTTWPFYRRYCNFSGIHIVSSIAFIINDGEFLCCIIWWSGLLSDLLKALIEDRDFVPVCLSQHVRVSLSPHLCPCTSAAGSSPHLLHRG